MPAWSLAREKNRDVAGFAYSGVVHTLSGVSLPNEILVLGYNHNLQSSYGVTNGAIYAIRDWISEAVSKAAA